MRERRALVAMLCLIQACGRDPTTPAVGLSAGCQIVGAAIGRVPITQLIDHTYLGFTGGLYPGCANTPPAAHDSAGLARGKSVQPLDVNGIPSTGGKVVLMSLGMSNTTQEFCSFSFLPPCDSWTFMGQAASDPAVNHSTLAMVNAARGGQSADFWLTSTATNYDLVRDNWLTPNGLSEKQVQIVWIKVANPNPTISLPSASADAYALVTQMGKIVRALKTRYPNLKQVFFSSRIYGGYGLGLNPEPYAYESAFAVKWLIEAQIAQMKNAGAVVDTRAGDLNLNTGTPWLGWSAYLWADGTTPRADGLVWNRSDIDTDGAHPTQSGETKVGAMLLTFFKSSPYSKCWFVAGGTCP